MSETTDITDFSNISALVASHVESADFAAAGKALSELEPADIAQIIAHYSDPELTSLFQSLREDLKPDVLAELPPDAAGELIAEMPTPDTADIASEMEPDDAADVLGELDKEMSAKIIEGMDEESANDVMRLMTYPKDSAGGIMTTNLLRLHKEQTVLQAMDAIAADPDEEHIYQVYITDDDGILLGYVTIWTLLRQKNRTIKLGEIMDTEILSVSSNTDQEVVAEIMAKYDLSVIPVVDDRGVLLGRVTHDDAADIIKEEAEEDILSFAGAGAEEVGRVSVIKSCLARIPWLLLTLVGGLFTASLMNSFTNSFKAFVILAAFIPNVMAMGGNTGIQSSILMVREMASGSARRHSLTTLLSHELRTALLMGFICSIVIFLFAIAVIFLTSAGQASMQETITLTNDAFDPATAPYRIAAIVAVALFSAMTFSACIGALLPIFLDKIHCDTAVASGPFISLVDDVFSVIIYYLVSVALLSQYLT